MTEKINELAKKYSKEIIELREYFHQYPELDLELYNTQKTLKDKLDALGLEYVEMAKTGLCVVIKGEKGDVNDPNRPTILLRGDMDALPIQEMIDVPYKSKIDGLMHACGHDGHAAGLFGALLILNELKSDLEGNVKFAFQPGEEASGGAEKMINEGILENPKVDMAFGIHLRGSSPEKYCTTKVGPMFASPDEFKIEIIGRGGHAAVPEASIDPVVIAAQVIIGLQNIRSRLVSTFNPLVLSCTCLEAGTAFNVIPGTATIKGTVRTLDGKLRDEVPKLMEQIVNGITSAYGATYKIDYRKYYPTVINDEIATKILVDSSKKIVGEENYGDLKYPSMGGEDFSYFGYKVPSAFLYVGIAQENKPIPVHHHPEFNYRSEIVLENSKILAQTAFDAINYLLKK